MCSDKNEELNDKLLISFNSKRNKVVFYLGGSEIKLITEITKKVERDFEVIYKIDEFYQILNLCKDDTEIEIDSTYVKFGKNSEYSFEAVEVDFSEKNIYLNLLNEQSTKTLIIKDLEKIGDVKPFKGKQELNLVGLIDSYFVTSDDIVTGIVKTKNNKNPNFYFSDSFSNLLRTMKVFEVTLDYFKDMNEYRFKLDNTFIFIKNKENCILPENLFSKEVKEQYLHPFTVIINKEEFYNAIKRIKIVAKNTIDTVINLKLEKDKMVIENQTGIKASEIVPAEISKEVINHSFLVSASKINIILSCISSKNVNILVSPQKDAVAITFQNETQEKMIVHNLLEMSTSFDDFFE